MLTLLSTLPPEADGMTANVMPFCLAPCSDLIVGRVQLLEVLLVFREIIQNVD
jgi:hypothetical protein